RDRARKTVSLGMTFPNTGAGECHRPVERGVLRAEELLDCRVDVDRGRIEHRHGRVRITQQQWEFRTAEGHGLDFLYGRETIDYCEDTRAGLVEEPTLDKLGEIPFVHVSTIRRRWYHDLDAVPPEHCGVEGGFHCEAGAQQPDLLEAGRGRDLRC